MSQYMEFNQDGFDHHSCTSRREGEWIIFECPECDYVRKLNRETNETVLVQRGDDHALHNGMYEPVGLQPDKLNLN